jgi:hypothetical protein
MGSEMLRAVGAAMARHEERVEEAERIATYAPYYEGHRTNVDAKIIALTWMVGINIVITLVVLWHLLTH